MGLWLQSWLVSGRCFCLGGVVVPVGRVYWTRIWGTRSWSPARSGWCCGESQGSGWPRYWPVLSAGCRTVLSAVVCSSSMAVPGAGAWGHQVSWTLSAGHCIGASAGVLSPVVCSVGVLFPSEMGVAPGQIGLGGAACQILKSSLPLPLDLKVGEVSACRVLGSLFPVCEAWGLDHQSTPALPQPPLHSSSPVEG